MAPSRYRIGSGFDIHRTRAGAKLTLGLVEIPSDLGLVSETDGDVVAHALLDALFAAAGVGDIGEHFPAGGARGQASRELLAEGMGAFRAEGMTLEQIDITVLADCVRLAPHYQRIKDALAEATGIPAAGISVKARTMEGLGEIGAGKAIAALVMVLATAGARGAQPAGSSGGLFTGSYPLEHQGEVSGYEILVWADGASRGNPGPASAAARGQDAQGAVLFEEGKYLGETTSNEAEYAAVLLALDSLDRLDAKDKPVLIQLDSALVFSQLTGKFKVRSPRMRELHRQVLARLAAFKDVRFLKVSRAENSKADRLANRVLDDQSK